MQDICDELRDLVTFVQFKNVKNTHGGVLLLVLKAALLHGWFLRSLIFTNGTRSRKTSHICAKIAIFLSTPTSKLTCKEI